jgi:hypothetical protein
MPRHHTIWDSELKQQVDIEFTAEEETARDAEEAQLAIEMAAAKERRARQEVLEAKLADDSITFDEMKELMRLRG